MFGNCGKINWVFFVTCIISGVITLPGAISYDDDIYIYSAALHFLTGSYVWATEIWFWLVYLCYGLNISNNS